MKTILLSTVFLGLLSTSATAGFEFTAPIQPKVDIVEDVIDRMPSVPSITVEEQVIPQVVPLSSNVVTDTSGPVMKNQFQKDVAQKDSSHLEISDVVVYAPSSIDMIAVGFGRDLPLDLAISQIIPEGYDYNIPQGFSNDSLVSWQGGKPWPVILKETLREVGLTAEINDKSVVISRMGVDTFLSADDVPISPNKIKWNPLVRKRVMVDMDNGVQTAMASEVIVSDVPQSIVPVNDAVEMLNQDMSFVSSSYKEDVINDVDAGQWIAQSGNSLKSVLEAWSNIEGVDLFWSADYDFILAGDVNISGDYKGAVEIILSGFSEANPKPTGRLHPNLPNGPAVLVVEAHEIHK